MNSSNRPSNPTSNCVPTGAIIAISVIAATAYAVYESPEVRQFLINLRRQAAHTLHSLGDNIEPRERREEEPGQPLFNRPEDAEGVLDRGGVDADDASRRRQREELEYWNNLRKQKKKEEKEQSTLEDQCSGGRGLTRSSSFGDFLAQGGEQGTYVLRTGAEPALAVENLVHRRGGRGIDHGAMFANPFADENGIELGSRGSQWGWSQVDKSQSLMTPGRDEAMSVASEADTEGLYCASDNRIRRPVSNAVSSPRFTAPVPFPPVEQLDTPAGIVELPSSSQFSAPEQSAREEQLIDTSEPEETALAAPVSRAVDELAEETQYATSASLPHEASNSDAYAAIHAWADGANSTAGFYSPLPATPHVLSEASDGGFGSEEGSSHGAATPRTVDSVSVVGVESEGEGVGRSTPGSWTEVGSVVSSLEGRVL